MEPVLHSNALLEIPLRALEVYTILDELEQGSMNDPVTLVGLTAYLRDVLKHAGLPDTREEYEEQYCLPHPENEQYKRLTNWLDAEKKEKV